jgi:uncharacterized protein (TIGR02145 family)
MKNVLYTVLLMTSVSSFGQIVLNINRASGSFSTPITQIDSIRFGGNQMELVLTTGAPQNHILNGLVSVTFTGQLVGTVTALNCGGATTTGTLTGGTAASGVSTSVPYTGGNTGPYSAQSVTSTGVTGLTASRTADTLANGNGSVTYTITGTPALSGGTASFAISLGGQSCILALNVVLGTWPAGTVHCTAVPTAIVDVTNPTTGKIWMDRNLGASQVATSSQDALAFGDLYQWGRRADGHQCRTSPNIATLSSVDQPAHGDFIIAPNAPYDWRSPQNTNLWQGVNGINNPCPSGYRIPTQAENIAEKTTWTPYANSAGAFASPLKLPNAAGRYSDTGILSSPDPNGRYWSSTISGTLSAFNFFFTNGNQNQNNNRAFGQSVRCIKN